MTMRREIDILDLLIETYARRGLHKVYDRAGFVGAARTGYGGGSSAAVDRMAMLGTVVDCAGSHAQYVPDPEEDLIRVHEAVLALSPAVREDVIYYAACRAMPPEPQAVPPQWTAAHGFKTGRYRRARTEIAPTGEITGIGVRSAGRVAVEGLGRVEGEGEQVRDAEPIRWCRVICTPSAAGEAALYRARLAWWVGLGQLVENLTDLEGYDLSGPSISRPEAPEWLRRWAWPLDREG